MRGRDDSELVDGTLQILEIRIDLFHLDGLHVRRGLRRWQGNRFGTALELQTKGIAFYLITSRKKNFPLGMDNVHFTNPHLPLRPYLGGTRGMHRSARIRRCTTFPNTTRENGDRTSSLL